MFGLRRLVKNDYAVPDWVLVSIASVPQPAWPQLQLSSMVFLASAQYWLQYLLSLVRGQVQDGWAHFCGLSAIRPPAGGVARGGPK